jgi:Fic family protein
LLNSQIPYNQLPLLSELPFKPTDKLVATSRQCQMSLSYLKGYLDALPQNDLFYISKWFQLLELKYSFDLENNPISIQRLFESSVSKQKNNDKTTQLILGQFVAENKITGKDLSDFNRFYISKVGKKKSEFSLFRDKSKAVVKSYFTNLVLYTAPDQANVLSRLKKDLNKALLTKPFEDDLINLCLIHLQIRAVAPFTQFNDASARFHSQFIIQTLLERFIPIPFSQQLMSVKEDYNVILKNALFNEAYESWCLLLINAIQESIEKMIMKLKQIFQLKEKQSLILLKFTNYKLPDELILVLMKHPFVKTSDIMLLLNCHRQTAYTYLKQMVKAGLLISKKAGREQIYYNKELMDVLIY